MFMSLSANRPKSSGLCMIFQNGLKCFQHSVGGTGQAKARRMGQGVPNGHDCSDIGEGPTSRSRYTKRRPNTGSHLERHHMVQTVAHCIECASAGHARDLEEHHKPTPTTRYSSID